MNVFANTSRREHTLPGISHRTIAGHGDGLSGVEVWRQTLEPGAETPVHYHKCEEVIVVLSGSGRVTATRRDTRVEADSTIIVPARQVHQLINDGNEPMRVIAALSTSPGEAFSPDGERIPLPWQDA